MARRKKNAESAPVQEPAPEKLSAESAPASEAHPAAPKHPRTHRKPHAPPPESPASGGDKPAEGQTAQEERQERESRLFRPSAMQRLNSPEQLDQLMRVTSPMGWVAMAGAGICIIAAIVWSIFGEIPVKVAGKGILMRFGGMTNVVSTVGGRVRELKVQYGDIVETGQVVAVIAQPEIGDQLAAAERGLAEKTRDYEIAVGADATQLTEQQLRANEAQRKNLVATLAADSDKLVWLAEKLTQQQSLLADGLITKQNVVATQSDIEATNADIRRCYVELKKIVVDNMTSRKTNLNEVRQRYEAMLDAENQLQQLKTKIGLGTQVTAPCPGRVLEIAVKPGDVVAANASLFFMEPPETGPQELHALGFFEAGQGKRVTVGMPGRVSPSVAKKEEFGFIRGKVEKISPFPITAEGMNYFLRNAKLAEQLGGGATPLLVLIDLDEDSRTVSGFCWSTSLGYPAELQSGTICDVEAEIERRRPITLVIPALKKILSGDFS